jgi:hypothetical protein
MFFPSPFVVCYEFRDAKGAKFPGRSPAEGRAKYMSDGVGPSRLGTLPGLPFGRFRPVGGLITIALAVGLVGLTWLVRAPTTVPLIMAVVMLVVGIGVLLGFIPIQAPQDFYGGVVLVDVAILALIASADLPGQRGFAFGPGTAPRLFAVLLAGLGAAVALSGVFVPGPRIEKYKIRGPVLVIASIVMFSFLIREVGLVLASFATYLVAISGSREIRIVEAVIAAACMTGFCVLLFVYLLNLPFQLWPRFY